MVRPGMFSSLLAAVLGFICQGTNVVLIVVDDLGWNDHSLHNRDSDIQTNKLRDIVDNEAILLERFYTNPVCSPTRSSLMTGRYAFNMGMQHTETVMPGSTAHIPMNLDILPKIAKDAGYETYMIGKWHGGYSSWEYTPFFRGFDSFYGYLQAQEGYYDKMVSDLGMGYDFWKNDTVDWSAQGIHSTVLYQNEIYRVLSRATGNPFFLYLALQSLHIPIQPMVNSSLHTYACCQTNRWRREYCYLVMEMEHLVHFTIETLKQLDLYEDTLILFTTDNGGMVNFASEEDGTPIWPSSYGENSPLRGSKATLFEGGVRVTAFITGGVIRDVYRGTKAHFYSHITDFHVLIREMMNSPTDGLDGVNVFNPDWFKGVHFIQAVRDVVPINIIERGLSYTSVIWEGVKMIVGAAEALPGIDGDGPVLGCEKMPFITLFNLTEDPFEKRQLDCSQMWSLIMKLVDIITRFVGNPFYSEPQNNLLHLRALPKYNNGVWKPFIE